MRIGLVACAARKLDYAATAEELYVSNLFRKASSYARNAYDRWYILSARYGLVEPTMRLSPYDETPNTKSRADAVRPEDAMTDTTNRDAAEPCRGCGEHPGDNQCDGCHLDYCGDCIDAYGELSLCVACAIETGLDHA